MATTRTPAYRELADELRVSVRAGKYADGVALPTELQLAEGHGLSRQTVRRAMQALVAEGIIYRVAGRGTFAVPDARRYLRQIGSVEDLMGLSQDTELEIVEPLRRRIDVDVAGRLGGAVDSVHSVTFVRRHEGQAFCLTMVHLPSEVGRLLDDVDDLKRVGATSRATVIGIIDDRMERPVTVAEQSITATVATPLVQRQLGADGTQPILRIDRLYRDAAGVAVELATSWFLPDHYSYRVELHRQPS